MTVDQASDAGRLFKIVEDYPLLKKENELLKQEIELQEQESAIKDQVISLEQRRAEIYKEAFEAQQKLTEQALKLSNSDKTKPWQILSGLGLIAIIVTVIAAVF